ncbi:MAG: hypothetical protein JNL56_03910 [Alphaproteobacteria bacterium]|nr:hypothetical protein [Alphaproteobacteria bacterium]
MAGEDNRSGDAAIAALPLSVAAGDAPPPARRARFAIPRVVDYLIVATFIYFLF